MKIKLMEYLNSIIEPCINDDFVKYDGLKSIHPDTIPSFEYFSRINYGLIILIQKKSEKRYIEFFNKYLFEFLNTKSKCYVGMLLDDDQKSVELVPILLNLLINRRYLWDKYSSENKEILINWFSHVNNVRLLDNNWQFFGLVTNAILHELDNNYVPLIDQYWNKINDMYIGDGWYNDGVTGKIDYYNAFGFHFYSLVYYKYSNLTSYKEIIKNRSILFAQHYSSWFDSNGCCPPFGRSMIYRFAQSSFWSMMILCDILPENNLYMYEIIYKNISWWMEKNIVKNDGRFNLGYAYENHYLLDGYNSWGSPYWSLKTFLVLLAEQEFVDKQMVIEELNVSKVANFISSKYKDNISLYIGDTNTINLNHYTDKYMKFMYSSKYGFNISKDYCSLNELAFDSVLAFSNDNKHFEVREKNDFAEFKETFQVFGWKTKNNNITTIIVPISGANHLRIHYIKSKQESLCYDFGFPIKHNFDDVSFEHGDNEFRVSTRFDSEIIHSYNNNSNFKINKSANNTNVIFEHNIVPYVTKKIYKGNNLVVDYFGNEKNLIPKITITKKSIQMNKIDKVINIPYKFKMKKSLKRYLKDTLKRVIERILY